MRTFLTQKKSINTKKIVCVFCVLFNYKLKSIQTYLKTEQKKTFLIIHI